MCYVENFARIIFLVNIYKYVSFRENCFHKIEILWEKVILEVRGL